MSDHPRLPGRIAGHLEAGPGEWTRAASDVAFANPYLTVTVDRIVAPDGTEHPRIVVRPRPAVGIAAVDEDRRILLVEQYRHPMGRRMLEIPAGLMDVEGESALDCARRELLEETDLTAGHWSPLVELATSVGHSTETITLFVATDLAAAAEADRIEREAEEADMAHWWVDVDEALAAVRDGRIIDAKTVVAVQAVAAG